MTYATLTPVDMPFVAVTGTDVRPELVSVDEVGHHRTTVVNGERVWWFETATARDLFALGVLHGEYLRPNPPTRTSEDA